MELHEKVERIVTNKDLSEFVHELRVDLKTNPKEWENCDLDSFLEAIEAWVFDVEGYYKGRGEKVPEQPTWNFLGRILYAPKYYE